MDRHQGPPLHINGRRYTQSAMHTHPRPWAHMKTPAVHNKDRSNRMGTQQGPCVHIQGCGVHIKRCAYTSRPLWYSEWPMGTHHWQWVYVRSHGCRTPRVVGYTSCTTGTHQGRLGLHQGMGVHITSRGYTLRVVGTHQCVHFKAPGKHIKNTARPGVIQSGSVGTH